MLVVVQSQSVLSLTDSQLSMRYELCETIERLVTILCLKNGSAEHADAEVSSVEVKANWINGGPSDVFLEEGSRQHVNLARNSVGLISCWAQPITIYNSDYHQRIFLPVAHSCTNGKREEQTEEE
jgi:hypothetical protein